MVYYDKEHGHWVGTDPRLGDDNVVVAETQWDAEVGLKLLIAAQEALNAPRTEN